MLTVDIAINGKSLDKVTITNDLQHHDQPAFGSYDVEYVRFGRVYATRIESHRRSDRALALARDALAAVIECVQEEVAP